MMCFLATGLGWLFCLSKPCCHWKGQSCCLCNCNTFMCSIVCCMFVCFSACLLHTAFWEEGRGECEQNKQSTALRCLVNGEQRWRSAVVILQYTVCVGCLKRHVSSERPPRAGSLSASPVQIIQALQGICAAIKSLMIFFYPEWVGDLMLNPLLLLHRDSYNVLLTHRKLRIGPLMPNIDSL